MRASLRTSSRIFENSDSAESKADSSPKPTQISATRRIQRAICSISFSPRPRVVMAGVPKRTPEGRKAALPPGPLWASGNRVRSPAPRAVSIVSSSCSLNGRAFALYQNMCPQMSASLADLCFFARYKPTVSYCIGGLLSCSELYTRTLQKKWRTFAILHRKRPNHRSLIILYYENPTTFCRAR